MITLEVAPQDLWSGKEEEDLTYTYDTTIRTPYGDLGAFKAHLEDNQLVIDQADDVVLLKRDFPTAWNDAMRVGAETYQSPFGYRNMRFEGVNGRVVYRLFEDELRWSDRPGEAVPYHLAIKIFEALDG